MRDIGDDGSLLVVEGPDDLSLLIQLDYQGMGRLDFGEEPKPEFTRKHLNFAFFSISNGILHRPELVEQYCKERADQRKTSSRLVGFPPARPRESRPRPF